MRIRMGEFRAEERKAQNIVRSSMSSKSTQQNETETTRDIAWVPLDEAVCFKNVGEERRKGR